MAPTKFPQQQQSGAGMSSTGDGVTEDNISQVHGFFEPLSGKVEGGEHIFRDLEF